MVHDSVLDAIDDNSDSDYEDDVCEDEDDGELQSDFKAMDITSSAPAEERHRSLGVDREAADAAAPRTREFEPGKENPKKRKKKRRKGGSNPSRRGKAVSIEQFVVVTCRRIDEPKYPLFREAVERIGMDAMTTLLHQVDVIENCGGQMTADGLRRRTAGGVLWSLLRGHVGATLYKEIMKEGNRKHIEQQRARAKERENERGNGKRLHEGVEINERQDNKRRRTSVEVDGPKSRSVSRERLPRASLRAEVDNMRTPAALQNAWIQGLKTHSEREANGLNPKPSEEKGPKRPVSERLRMTVSYGDLVEEGEIATDSPIRGVTEGGDIRVEKGGCKGQINEEFEEEGELKEDGEMEEEGEIAD